MHLRDVWTRNPKSFSFEFFPPKSEEGIDSMLESISEFESLEPSFVSVTYGAGGSTRDRTHNLVIRLKTETSLTPMPHLTCVCHHETEIRGILERYADAGISNIMALRGDEPKGYEGPRHESFGYASDLVRFIK